MVIKILTHAIFVEFKLIPGYHSPLFVLTQLKRNYFNIEATLLVLYTYALLL